MIWPWGTSCTLVMYFGQMSHTAAGIRVAHDSCHRRRRWHVLLLCGIVLLGGWLRFSRLELMEFKKDEWRLHRLAVAQAEGKLQLHGLTSSVGVYNPPMAVYLFALPAFFNQDPVFLAYLPALLNTVAVGLTYLLARKWLSRWAALG